MFIPGVFLFILFVVRNKEIQKSVKHEVSSVTSKIFNRSRQASNHTVINKKLLIMESTVSFCDASLRRGGGPIQLFCKSFTSHALCVL